MIDSSEIDCENMSSNFLRTSLTGDQSFDGQDNYRIQSYDQIHTTSDIYNADG
jgi:hypothetical protein